MKYYCIINTSYIGDDLHHNHLRLPRCYGPTCFYLDKEPAEKELFRLKQKHPGAEFYLFESTAKIVSGAVNPNVFYIEEITKDG